MKGKRVLGLILSLALAISLLLPAIAVASPPEGVGNPNPEEPRGRIVPKITIEDPAKIPPAGPAPGAKPPKPAATGKLGDALGSGAQLWAIIIGIADYAGTVADLRYADDDAVEMRATLIERYGYPAGHIRLLLGDKDRQIHSDIPSELATQANIQAAIASVATQEEAGDEVVFYYSGHGAGVLGDPTANQGIVPWELTLEKVIWDVELASWFSKSSGFDTSRIVFGFDSCFAGGMSEVAHNGRIVAMATTATDYAYEFGGRIRNGEFTYWFVDDGMYDGRADYYDSLPGRADVTVEEAWDWADAHCVYDDPQIADHFFTNKDLLLGYYEAVTPPPAGTMHVASITFSSKLAGPNLFLYTTVKVVDATDPTVAVSGATVAMTLAGPDGPWLFAGDTNNGSGEVTFTLRKAAPGVYTATVTSVTHPDYDWDLIQLEKTCTLDDDGTVHQ